VTDDLKALPGIGTATEHLLHAGGIFTFAQLAELSPQELEAMVPGLSGKRRSLAAWISEAKKRALGLPQQSSAATAEAARSGVTFRVELPLGEDGTVRGTHVTHLESGDERSWPGFDEDHLVRFIAQAATGRPREVEQSRLPTRREPVASAQEPDATESVGLSGVLRLRDVEALVADRPGRAEFLQEDQPFTVRARLDLTGLETRRDLPLSYSIGVYANGLVHGHRRIVGEERGTTSITDEIVTVEMEAAGLPKDVYRLTAFVTLTPVAAEGSVPPLAASVDEGPIQVA
jgi:Helix-hairpin-helix domain